IHDSSHSVRVVVDRDLQAAARLSFHPNINTATLVVSKDDFVRFLAACGNPGQYIRVCQGGTSSQPLSPPPHPTLYPTWVSDLVSDRISDPVSDPVSDLMSDPYP